MFQSKNVKSGKRVALDLKLENGKFLVFSLEKGAEFQGKLNLIEALSDMPLSHYKTTS